MGNRKGKNKERENKEIKGFFGVFLGFLKAFFYY
jgi:hypothetical protein